MRPLLLVLGLLLACVRPETSPGAGTPGGTLIIATGAEADHLLPALVATSVGKQVSDALFLPLARVGDEGNVMGEEGFTGVLADTWEWSADSLTLRFTLDAAARWHDGRPVRADDVSWSFEAYRNPAVASDVASRLANIAAVTAEDSLHVSVRFTRRNSTQFYDVVQHLVPFPRHVHSTTPAESLRASAAARAPVGNGKFRFAAWLPGQRIEVVADTSHWLGRPSLDRVVWSVVPDPNAQVAQLIAGEADLVEALRGPALQQAAADTNIVFLARPAVDYVVAVFNLRERRRPDRPHPVLGDLRVRQALSLALDRAILVRAVLDSLGAPMTSPYLTVAGVRGVTFPLPDSARARDLLAEAGFADADGDGILERRGQRLSLALSAPGSSAGRLRLQTLLVDAWGRLGADVRAEVLDNPTMMGRNEAADFDISLLGYSGTTTSPGDLGPQWRSTAARQGTNWGGYASPAFDAQMDSAAATVDPRVARQHYARAGQVLVDDVPAIWMYEAKLLAGYHRRLRPGPVSAGAWWAHLDEWSVDPARLLPRDRLGPGTAPPR